ncbi:MAG: S8 family serine peptidase [Clostridiales bacterium]|nr:S8 family serine peptidase [Clostridiales bacterium]
MKMYIGILLLITGIAVNTAVLSAEETEVVESYIVKYKADAVHLFSADETPIEFTENLYVVDAENIDSLIGNSNIEYIEPNYEAELFGCPDDEYYDEQWGLNNWGYNNIFETSNNGKGARVGIIDSGAYTSHPDLESISTESYNVIDSEDTCEDTYGHGTFVAGIIGAATNNGIGVSGIAPEADIIMLKCFSDKTTKVSYVISALNYAAELDLDVLNMSFGMSFTNTGGSNSLALQEVVNNLADSGTIIVAAVGNSSNSTLYYPVAYDNVIGVGSIGSDFTVASSSQNNESVFVTAPGENIYGLWSPDTDEGIYYTESSGTSFAAPYVTGLIALAKAYDETLDFEGACELLKNSVKDLGDTGYDTAYGWGVVNPKVFWDNLYGGTKVFITQPSCVLDDDSKGITCSQIFINNSGEELNFYYALYENSRFTEVEACESADKTYIEFENEISNDTVIKCFIWDSLNSIIPYFDSVVIN